MALLWLAASMLWSLSFQLHAQSAAKAQLLKRTSSQPAASHMMVTNPILPGFNPDPSICRVDSDYYLVTSSFMFSPGLPIYHSRDLAHWQLVGHAIDGHNIGKFHFKGLTDNDGCWAPTLRYHDGIFYLICTLHNGGGNFVVTAADPRGPWSDPVWIPEASGIDPTLFWDDDGRAYYLGNRWDQPHQWTGQVAVWLQEIDLSQPVMGRVEEKKTGLSFQAPTYRLLGKPRTLSFGHAAQARYAEGPHLYKIGRHYCLLMAEGGSGKYHAVTVHWADSLFGPYRPQEVNPVLTHRHMGRRYGVQNVGHADLVTLPEGGYAAVCLANRMLPIPGEESKPYVSPLGRETWLTDVRMEDGQLIFAPDQGQLSLQQPLRGIASTTQQPRPTLGSHWYTPLTMPQLRLRKILALSWRYSLTLTPKSKERGLTVFRTVHGNYMLTLADGKATLVKTERGEQQVVAERIVSSKKAGRKAAETTTLAVQTDGMLLCFYVDDEPIAAAQSMLPLCDDGKYNKFNGTGVGYILK